MSDTPQQQPLFGPEPSRIEIEQATIDAIVEAAAAPPDPGQEALARDRRQLVEQWLDTPPTGPAAVETLQQWLIDHGVFDGIASKVLSAAQLVSLRIKTGSGERAADFDKKAAALTAKTQEVLTDFVRGVVADPEYRGYLAREVLIESHLQALDGYAIALQAIGQPAAGEIDLGQPDEPGSFWDFYAQLAAYYQELALDIVVVEAAQDLGGQIVAILSSTEITDALDALGERLGQIRGSKPKPRHRRRRAQAPAIDLRALVSSSAQPFSEARRALLHAKSMTTSDASPFPTTEVRKRRFNMTVQLVPGQIDDMLAFGYLPPDERAVLERIAHRMLGETTPLAAHALTGICHLWLQKASGPDSVVDIRLDELIAMRGTRAKKSGSGRRGGYRPEQRREMLQAVMQAGSLWVRIELDDKAAKREGKPFVETRVFVVTDRAGQKLLDGELDYQSIRIMPGRDFARYLWRADRQTALIGIATLGLDPYRHVPETRLSYYFDNLWRVRASTKTYTQPFHVSTLLAEAGLLESAAGYERLEKALDLMLERRIFAAWQYEDGFDGTITPATRVTIEPTDWICSQYAEIEQPQQKQKAKRAPRRAAAVAVAGPGDSLGERLGRARRRLGLSQMIVAEEAGVSQRAYSEAERGVRAGDDVRRKLGRWLERVEVAAEDGIR